MQKWRGLATITSALFTVILCITVLASSFTREINSFMGIQSAEIINKNGQSVDDEELQRYKSEYDSIDEMLLAKSELCEEITDEGIVLLKNSGSLPLKDVKKITCLGRGTTDLMYAGASGAGIIGNVGTSINATLKQGLEKAGFEVNPKMWDFYSESEYASSYGGSGEGGSFCTGEVPVEEYPEEKGYEEYSDACIVLFTRNAGESNDAPIGEYEDGEVFYRLNDIEKGVLEEAKSNFDTVVVIINSPSAVEVEELKQDEEIDALLTVGGLGMNGAYSIGKVLNGEVNPSGHLVDTWAVNSLSSPAIQNQGDFTYTNADEITKESNNGASESNTKYLVQAEGIYIGYKYYETRYEDCVLNQGNASGSAGVSASEGKWSYAEEVSYSFGYGMSYTEFTQEVQSIQVEDDVVKAAVKVTNIGDVAGKAVVQLYAQSPYTDYDKTNKVEKSAVQLMNFGKTALLQPGETEEVTVKMDLYNICSYDENQAETWILEDGDYYFAIGESAHDALNNILAAKGRTIADGMDYDGDETKVYHWENEEFRKFDDPEFSEDGFATLDGYTHVDTDAKVTNQLECADLNTWIEDGVTYLSRSDWENTWPEPYAELTATEEMKEHLLARIYEPGDEDTSEIITDADTDYQISMMIGKDYDDPDWDLILNQMSMEEMMSLVGKDFSATEPIPSIGYPGAIENDGPSGPVTNYATKYNTGETIFEGIEDYSTVNPRMYPSECVLASTYNQELSYEMGEMFGEDALYTGQNAIWTPGANLHRTPYSGRNFEYYSEDSIATYVMGAQQVAGIQSKGAVAAPKHFAFNDYETNRFGLSTFMTEQTARENALRGFEGLVSVGRCHNLMTTLSRIGCDWVGMNIELQNNILRDEWGFDGYTVTDNAIKPYMYGYAVTYGTDKFLVFIPGRYEEQLSEKVVSKDAKLLSALRESCHRILYVNVNSKLMNGVSNDVDVKDITPGWKMALIIIEAILALLTIINLIFFVRSKSRYNKAKEENKNE